MRTSKDLSLQKKCALQTIFNTGIVDVQTPEIENMLKTYIEKKVKEVLRPYIRGEEPVKLCPSINMYKVRVPKALIKTDTKPPQYAKTKEDLYVKLYDYLFGGDTLEVLYDKWHKSRQEDPTVGDRTVDRDKQQWEKYYKSDPIIKMHIEDIAATDILSFYKRVWDNGNATRKMLNNVKSIMNYIYDYAIEQGYIQVNAARSVSTRKWKCRIPATRKPYTNEERAKLFLYLQNITLTKENQYYVMGVMLMFCLDIRIGELIALKWDDIDWQSKTIRIARMVESVRDENGVYHPKEIEHLKCGDVGVRDFPLTSKAISILERIRFISKDGLILKNQAGKPLNTNKFNRYLKAFCTAAGIEYKSSHSIRYSAVSSLAEKGTDLKTLQYLSGHRCKDTTLHYIEEVTRKEDARRYADECFN